MKFYQNTTFTNSYAVKRELEDEKQCLELEVEGLKKEKAKLDKLEVEHEKLRAANKESLAELEVN